MTIYDFTAPAKTLEPARLIKPVSGNTAPMTVRVLAQTAWVGACVLGGTVLQVVHNLAS